jgi:hypothetical protein
MDGYSSGHGLQLANFLTPIELVNGLSLDDEGKRVANGMPCLADQLVAHFKTGVGGIYLEAIGLEKDYGQEYEYYIFDNTVRVFEIDPTRKVIFQGTWKEFLTFCETV